MDLETAEGWNNSLTPRVGLRLSSQPVEIFYAVFVPYWGIERGAELHPLFSTCIADLPNVFNRVPHYRNETNEIIAVYQNELCRRKYQWNHYRYNYINNINTLGKSSECSIDSAVSCSSTWLRMPIPTMSLISPFSSASLLCPTLLSWGSIDSCKPSMEVAHLFFYLFLLNLRSAYDHFLFGYVFDRLSCWTFLLVDN